MAPYSETRRTKSNANLDSTRPRIVDWRLPRSRSNPLQRIKKLASYYYYSVVNSQFFATNIAIKIAAQPKPPLEISRNGVRKHPSQGVCLLLFIYFLFPFASLVNLCLHDLFSGQCH
ncbi:uncharacterized protein BDCG_17437 [Blastomyces dermatitidis ER-3]|uniref:Uncharacterized protein n=2 Tax=Ajellomyces dermatitidis TaxID=5039 RepID=A0A0J9ERG0_AJEDA|nr:uncharacterized protein BDCG_17437 [Blastomyces dermatitidis ER-3]KMW68621.1 hypothetical protein BDDG_12928 [Blastomyces dermatitidis ATCC 18188]OAT02214.1 hypothetical protein BDCG_17437 [Blastomyces dermatitidis ER-3]